VTLPAPNLDDRTFQSLVDEAKRMVQRKWPEWTGWTDHNVSDPGVTLIETFAYMTEQLIYRLNRVPDLNYIKFLELIGIELRPPHAASTDVTFWLTAPRPHNVPVPIGTVVATPRTDSLGAVTFSTVETLDIVPCSRIAIGAQPAGSKVNDHTDDLAIGKEVSLFSERPRVGDTFYVGLSSPVPRCIVALRFDGNVEGYGIDPTRPPRSWEAKVEGGWAECEIERDETGGFNRAGDVVLHIPHNHIASADGGRHAAWLRCRVVETPAGASAYMASPKVRNVSAMTIGGTAASLHAEDAVDEVLGLSEGMPGQLYELAHRPVVFGSEPEQIEAMREVEEPDGAMTPIVETWTRVDTFGAATATDRCFRLDATAGRIQFGPGVRHPDGSVDQRGAVPPRGSVLRVPFYRHGGGNSGNVSERTLTVLKSSVPSVARCENRRPAFGGVDSETLEAAKQRAPLAMRTRDRAVTAEDYEYLTLQAERSIARVRCLESTSEPGVARVVVVPHVGTSDDLGSLRLEHLQPTGHALDTIREDLARRRIVGTRVMIERAHYQGVTVVARLVPWRTANALELRRHAEAALYRYLHPIWGGPDGDGWPFGRTLMPGDLNSTLSKVRGVDMVEEILIFEGDSASGAQAPQPSPRITLPSNALFLSLRHQVRVEDPR
jgi:predicted phage baseplate assembly protein